MTYLAPRITYAPDSLPRDRLLALMQELSVSPSEVLGGLDAPAAQRLAAYWHARDRFIALGRNVRPSADPASMLAQLQAPLLDLLRESPDFRPAYDPLLQMARALAASDRPGARRLLQSLAEAQPAREEAQRILQSMQF